MSKILNTSGMKIIRAPDGSYHYICHVRKIMTMGFGKRHGLIASVNGFLGTDKAMKLMRDRYQTQGARS